MPRAASRPGSSRPSAPRYLLIVLHPSPGPQDRTMGGSENMSSGCAMAYQGIFGGGAEKKQIT